MGVGFKAAKFSAWDASKCNVFECRFGVQGVHVKLALRGPRLQDRLFRKSQVYIAMGSSENPDPPSGSKIRLGFRV